MKKKNITSHVNTSVGDSVINTKILKEEKRERALQRAKKAKISGSKKKRAKFYSQKDWVSKYEDLIEDPAAIPTGTSSGDKSLRMVNFYFDPLKLMSQYVNTNMALGFPRKKVRLLNSLYLQHVGGLHPGIPVAMGKRCIETVLSRSRELKRDFIYIDHAYFFRGHYLHPGRSDIYYRVIVNDIHANMSKNMPKDRFESFGIKVKDWRRSGDHILICPPTGYLEDMIGLSKSWLYETVSTIRKNSDRPIIIRQKPGLTKSHKLVEVEKSFKKIKAIVKTDDRPLSVDLKKCWAIVAPASGASIEAIISGVPSFCEPASPVSSISINDYSKIENPLYNSREQVVQVMANLAYSQFSITEMKNGYAFMVLKSKYPRIFRHIK